MDGRPYRSKTANRLKTEIKICPNSGRVHILLDKQKNILKHSHLLIRVNLKWIPDDQKPRSAEDIDQMVRGVMEQVRELKLFHVKNGGLEANRLSESRSFLSMAQGTPF